MRIEEHSIKKKEAGAYDWEGVNGQWRARVDGWRRKVLVAGLGATAERARVFRASRPAVDSIETDSPQARRYVALDDRHCGRTGPICIQIVATVAARASLDQRNAP
jgi:hypothetical protein